MKFLKNNFLIILFIIIFTIQCFNIWQEKYNYLEIYSPYKVIKRIKGRKKYGVYRFINQL